VANSAISLLRPESIGFASQIAKCAHKKSPAAEVRPGKEQAGREGTRPVKVAPARCQSTDVAGRLHAQACICKGGQNARRIFRAAFVNSRVEVSTLKPDILEQVAIEFIEMKYMTPVSE